MVALVSSHFPCSWQVGGRPLLPYARPVFTVSLQTQIGYVEKACVSYKCLLFSSKEATVLGELERYQGCALVSIRPAPSGNEMKLPTQHPYPFFWHQYLLYSREHSFPFQFMWFNWTSSNDGHMT